MAKAKKMKMDFSKAKEFMITKGERLGLLLSATLMSVLLIYGIIVGLSTSSAHEKLVQAARSLENRVESSEADPEVVGPFPKVAPSWVKIDRPDRYFSMGWFDPGAVGDSKLRNPLVLPIDTVNNEQFRQIQMDVVRAPILTYWLDKNNRDGAPRVYVLVKAGEKVVAKGERTTAVPAYRPVAKRLVVVSATFPIREQMERFRKALRKISVADLFSAPETAPRFLGLIVQRHETAPNGKTTITKLYGEGPDNTAVVLHPGLNKVFTESVYDETNVDRYQHYMYPGLTTPLPKLAYGEYPKLELSEIKSALDITEDEDDPQPMKPPMVGVGKPPLPGVGPGQPKQPPMGVRPGQGKVPFGFGMQPPEAGVDVEARDWEFKKVLKEKLAVPLEQFEGKYYPFDKLGTQPDFLLPEAVGGIPQPKLNPPMGGKQPIVPMKNPPPMQGGGKSGEPGVYPDYCLVRFVDVDVKPGHTYSYSVQVRMANPNYGNTARVAYPALAKSKELPPSAPVMTPALYVEPEINYYLVDQMEMEKGFDKRATQGADIKKADKHHVAVQIHKWVEKAEDSNGIPYDVGDWAVAERILVPRGGYIGKERVAVEIPQWNKLRNAYEVGAAQAAIAKKDPKKPVAVGKKAGLLEDFVPARPNPPLLVDFDGGTRTDHSAGTSPTGTRLTVPDDTAVEALVLTHDGKLILRNSREESTRESRAGRERLRQYVQWRMRIETLMAEAAAALTPVGTGAAGTLPGVPKRQ